MEIKINAPPAVVEPNTTLEEVVVIVNTRLERLESTINASLVSPIAEARTESEASLTIDLTAVRAKPISRRKDK